MSMNVPHEVCVATRQISSPTFVQLLCQSQLPAEISKIRVSTVNPKHLCLQ